MHTCYDKIEWWLFPIILILSADYEEQWVTVSDLFNAKQLIISGVWCHLSVAALVNAPVLSAWSCLRISMTLPSHLNPDHKSKPKLHSKFGRKADVGEMRCLKSLDFVLSQCAACLKSHIELICILSLHWLLHFRMCFGLFYSLTLIWHSVLTDYTCCTQNYGASTSLKRSRKF